MPFVFRINATGAQTISRDLARLGDAGVRIARAVLEDKTRRMAELAKDYAPVEDGDLKNRIRATRPQAARDGTVTASVLAGSSVIQHEDLTLQHTRGGPKFIERAVMLLAPEIPEALAAGMKKAADL
jgi:hypothetical protein